MKKWITLLVLCMVLSVSLVSCVRIVREATAVTEMAEVSIGGSLGDTAVFPAGSVRRITFYLYYGGGKGSDVPVEHMTEIAAWLGTFAVDQPVEELPPPGTNTQYVEIEYANGSIVKCGLDMITIDGVNYSLKHAPAPDCLMEILAGARME